MKKRRDDKEKTRGKLPKEELAKGKVGEIVEKCISLESAERYTDQELLGELESIS